MNYLQLCQRVRQECGGAGSGPSSVLNQTGENKLYTDWVQQAWLEIQLSQQNWFFMWDQTTVDTLSGISVYALDATIGNIDSDSMTIDGDALPIAGYKSILTDTGKPTAFSMLPNGKLALNSVPLSAHTLAFDYFTAPVSLVENTDTPALPEHLHMIIVYKAMMFYGAYENATEVYADATQKYGELYSSLASQQLPAISVAGTLA